jgi:hypothetical protein
MQSPIKYLCLQLHYFEEITVYKSVLIKCVLHLSVILYQKTYAVVQELEALCYKPRGNGFDSR